MLFPVTKLHTTSSLPDFGACSIDFSELSRYDASQFSLIRKFSNQKSTKIVFAMDSDVCKDTMANFLFDNLPNIRVYFVTKYKYSDLLLGLNSLETPSHLCKMYKFYFPYNRIYFTSKNDHCFYYLNVNYYNMTAPWYSARSQLEIGRLFVTYFDFQNAHYSCFGASVQLNCIYSYFQEKLPFNLILDLLQCKNEDINVNSVEKQTSTYLGGSWTFSNILLLVVVRKSLRLSHSRDLYGIQMKNACNDHIIKNQTCNRRSNFQQNEMHVLNINMIVALS